MPITIISGFLGAGKSTLVKSVDSGVLTPFSRLLRRDYPRRVLTEKHGYRIAVIMNEFGDTAVRFPEVWLVSSTDPLRNHRTSKVPQNFPGHSGQTHKQTAKTINVSSDSQQSEEFLELANGCLCCSIKDSGVAAIENLMKRKGAFDYILLETTGLADPGRLLGPDCREGRMH